MSKEYKDYKAVVFDLDGVIFDSEKKVIECWKDIANKYNIIGIENACKQCLGMNRDATREKMKEIFGQDFAYDEKKAEMSELFHSRYSNGRLPLKQGIKELLTALKENDIKIAVASSSRSEYVKGELNDAGLLIYFDEVICGDMVENSKPDPEIYIKACKKINVSVDEAFAIEDSFNGVRSASSAGLRTIMVPDLIPPDEEMRQLTEIILDNLYDVQKYMHL